ncbi:esterase [Altererythrobacter sp. B11]|uniref:alpha/beta hydrolase n=1 Tax=Altererythrobacter sp. B11 TaxID=2060312 RepID=UPI000DC7102E|nr:alpha/beta hydrolase [Altererythrobacter sp. B11]BBC72251.1 esterase [Altererythrobacter sp. B11]
MPRLETLLRFALAHPHDLAGPGRPVVHGARHQWPDRVLPYGPNPLQQLDFYRAGDGSRPLLVFLHGGAWQFGDKARRLKDCKAPFAHEQGWHFASIGFRMVPEVGVAEMARDCARGIRLLVEEAATLGIDPARIVLMGHSSGAHLAALLGCDPAYMEEQGLAVDMLAGIIANDGSAYDAGQPSVGPRWLHRRLIAPAFPGEPSERAALSPVCHASRPPNAPRFLILHTAHGHGSRQAHALEEALRRGGTPVERHGFAGRGTMAHVRMSRRFGVPGHPATEITRRWLVEHFGAVPRG